MAKNREAFSLARKNNILTTELPDEVLVYDLDRHRAYCLNQTAAAIWNLCDGNTSVAEMAIRLNCKAMSPLDEEVIRYGLELLERHHLLEGRMPRSPYAQPLLRRDIVRKFGLSISIPVVISVLAPAASASASCVGTPCSSDAECQARGCTGCSVSFPRTCL